ncbi:hypothetical protein [Pontibacter sp. H249]|uniref:hypothetical protein n=1 Tax=Pontibacter sp. H249 TaxID=3133420 RepID=UPI0030BADBEA
MVLFDNSLIKLDYFPATDVLEVAYPDLHDYLLLDIKSSIDILVDTIISYDVKRVLLDSSNTIVAVDAEQSRMITAHLVKGFMTTRITKLARLQSFNETVEATAHNNIKYATENFAFPFELKNFSNKPDALEWLQSI